MPCTLCRPWASAPAWRSSLRRRRRRLLHHAGAEAHGLHSVHGMHHLHRLHLAHRRRVPLVVPSIGWHHLHGMRGAGPDHGHPRHHPMHWHAWTHPIGVEELLARHAPGHVASVALPLARKVQVLAARAHPVAWAHVQARVLRVSGFWHRREFPFDSGGEGSGLARCKKNEM